MRYDFDFWKNIYQVKYTVFGDLLALYIFSKFTTSNAYFIYLFKSMESSSLQTKFKFTNNKYKLIFND